MDVADALAKLRARRDRLQAQIPKLQKELQEISITLTRLKAMLGGALSDEQEATLFDAPADSSEGIAGSVSPLPSAATARRDESGRRVPLSARRKELSAFLKDRGSASRVAILAGTSIPPGSLSALLARGRVDGWLVQLGSGTWRLAS